MSTEEKDAENAAGPDEGKDVVITVHKITFEGSNADTKHTKPSENLSKERRRFSIHSKKILKDVENVKANDQIGEKIEAMDKKQMELNPAGADEIDSDDEYGVEEEAGKRKPEEEKKEDDIDMEEVMHKTFIFWEAMKCAARGKKILLSFLKTGEVPNILDEKKQENEEKDEEEEKEKINEDYLAEVAGDGREWGGGENNEQKDVGLKLLNDIPLRHCRKRLKEELKLTTKARVEMTWRLANTLQEVRIGSREPNLGLAIACYESLLEVCPADHRSRKAIQNSRDLAEVALKNEYSVKRAELVNVEENLANLKSDGSLETLASKKTDVTDGLGLGDIKLIDILPDIDILKSQESTKCVDNDSTLVVKRKQVGFFSDNKNNGKKGLNAKKSGKPADKDRGNGKDHTIIIKNHHMSSPSIDNKMEDFASHPDMKLLQSRSKHPLVLKEGDGGSIGSLGSPNGQGVNYSDDALMNTETRISRDILDTKSPTDDRSGMNLLPPQERGGIGDPTHSEKSIMNSENTAARQGSNSHSHQEGIDPFGRQNNTEQNLLKDEASSNKVENRDTALDISQHNAPNDVGSQIGGQAGEYDAVEQNEVLSELGARSEMSQAALPLPDPDNQV
eukprot:jgi/Bigna1/132863/aug1.19_g7571